MLGLEVTRVQTNRPLFSTNAVHSVHLKMSVTTEIESVCESARLQDCNMSANLSSVMHVEAEIPSILKCALKAPVAAMMTLLLIPEIHFL